MRSELGMLGALIVMCIALALSKQAFNSQRNVLNTTKQIAMLGIFATGVSFVIITGGIDLSGGSVVGLTGRLISKIPSPAPRGVNQANWHGTCLGPGGGRAPRLGRGVAVT